MPTVHLLIITVCFPLLVSGLSFDDAAGTVRLRISQGELLGTRIDAYDNRTGYGFLGVPFAAPPVGQLRFAKPMPASGWTGVLNVTVKGVACPAVGELTYKRPEGGPMGEDCLHAYVYASKNCLVKGGCPIMWVLHGGAFNFESPVIFVDDVIVHNFASDGQDVIVIIPAYRLENFGFLNIAPGLSTSAVPNAGVWDLLLAMQWTHRNARFFGGDPEKISIFGHSAGAGFADTISTCPRFEGLFRGLVIMSGAGTGYDSGIKSNSQASWVSATILGCTSPTTNRSDITVIESVLGCMRAKTWEEIVQANRELNNHVEDYHGPHADGPGGIFPQSPYALSSKRRPVPMMIGTTTAEFHDTKYALNPDGTANLSKVGELCEAFGYAMGYTHPDVMSKRCLDYYMQGKRVMSLEQDAMFFMPTFKSVSDMTKRGSKVYLYSFSYTGVGEAFKKYVKMDKEDHPGHSEDYAYMLGMHRGNFTAKDYKIEQIYSGMVRNFIKTGYPYPGVGQPAWKPFSTLGRDYYEIDFDDNLRMAGMRKGYQAGAVKLWADDAEKYGGPLTPLEEFPPHFDQFSPMDVAQSYASHYMHASAAHDKTSETEDDAYYIWTNFTNDRRLRHLLGRKNLRSIVIEEPELAEISAPHGNNLMEILLIFVCGVFLFLLFRCCFSFVDMCQERKGYEEF